MKKFTYKYDKLSQLFHWMTAGLVLAAFVLGPGDFGQVTSTVGQLSTRQDIIWHESIGITVFMLTLLRLIWVAIRPGAPQNAMSASMRTLAKLTHTVLWVLLLALPLCGLLTLASESQPLTLLGGLKIDLSLWMSGSSLLKMTDWGEVHKFLGDSIIWLAGFHALAAIYHHVKLKDKVLISMLR